jgi:hypothetical protein
MEAYKLVATHEHLKEKKDQRDMSSTACETEHTKEMVDAQNRREYEKSLEESSRFVERHAERIY